MNEETLLRLSLLGALIGLFSLYLVFTFTDLPEISLVEVDELQEGDEFSSYGEIVFVRETDKVVEFRLVAYHPEFQKAVYFKDSADKIFNFSKGQEVSFEGQLYQNQIIINEFID